MTTFVLVHGAWSGAHGWRKLRPLLREAGHDVFTPSLTGIGERSHLTSPQVTLSTHVQDVVNTVQYEDLRDIVLLGYSYGGIVITGCIDYIGERVQHLVYLDAFLPSDGQSLSAMTGTAAGAGPRPLPAPGDWLVAPLPRAFDDPADAEFFAPRRTAQPNGTFTEPVRLLRPLEIWPFSLTYIKATGEPRPRENDGGPFWIAADKTRASPRWAYYEIATNHMIPQSRPQELANVLIDVAR